MQREEEGTQGHGQGAPIKGNTTSWLQDSLTGGCEQFHLMLLMLEGQWQL